MQIQENTSINWSKRQVINKLYIENSVEVELDQEDTKSVKSGRVVNTKMLLVTGNSIQLRHPVPLQGNS
jgi:hypothetical protein